MKSTLKQQIYSQILEDIIQGKYSPQTIITEKALIERFEVSKSPVRDALIELCNEGVLRSIPRVGYEVVQLTEKLMREIMEFRFILEAECIRKITASITDTEIKLLEDFLTKSEEWAENQQEITDHWKNNISFHLLLISFAKNQYMYEQIEKAMNTQLRGYAQFHFDLWRQTRVKLDMNTHKQIVRAIEENDPDIAVHYLREDLGLLSIQGDSLW